jgi:hypothetical protein
MVNAMLNEYLTPGFSGHLDTGVLGVNLPIYADIKESNCLVVFLNGSINRSIKKPPVFQRQSWVRDIPFSSVVVSDKTVELNDTLELAWYLGEPDGNYLRSVVLAILKIRDALCLQNEQIVFYGTSGGGYAGILLASIIRGSSCIAGNAQTDLSKYNYNFFDKFITDTGYQKSDQKINIMEYLSDKKYIPPITFLQNIQDVNHFNSHYMPFLKWYGSNRCSLHSGGVCEFIEYDKEGGHGGVPDLIESIAHIERVMNRTVSSKGYVVARDRVSEAIQIDTFYDSLEIEGVFEVVGEKLLVFITGDFLESDIKLLLDSGWRLSSSVGYYKYLISNDVTNRYIVEFPRMAKEYESGIIRWASRSEIKVKILDSYIAK